jgi:hypothetical protein
MATEGWGDWLGSEWDAAKAYAGESAESATTTVTDAVENSPPVQAYHTVTNAVQTAKDTADKASNTWDTAVEIAEVVAVGAVAAGGTYFVGRKFGWWK